MEEERLDSFEYRYLGKVELEGGAPAGRSLRLSCQARLLRERACAFGKKRETDEREREREREREKEIFIGPVRRITSISWDS